MVVSFIGGENQNTRRKPTDLSKVTDKLYLIILYRVQLAMSENRTHNLVMIGTDCIGSCKSNYHTITTTTVPKLQFMILRLETVQNEPTCLCYHLKLNTQFPNKMLIM